MTAYCALEYLSNKEAQGVAYYVRAPCFVTGSFSFLPFNEAILCKAQVRLLLAQELQ